ncbi:Large, multifunctional secreted protein [Planctomycetales bacterium 10988]|nr:Large, multifunctional secreted protein [Planctomycetales bacterium 10988]
MSPAGNASRWLKVTTLSAVTLTMLSTVSMAFYPEYLSGIVWPEPPVITPGTDGGPPSDAIVLFDGTDLSRWEGGEQWEIKDGYAVTAGGEITTKQEFGDIQIHLEWASPVEVEGDGQGRGNSGIFLAGRYEIQILDSYNNPTYFDGQAGSLYKQQPPMVNACRPPGEWQTYDILFSAPRFDENQQLMRPGYVTVLHNGVAVHHRTEIKGNTAFNMPAMYEAYSGKGPLALQFHRDQVRFRNIWVRELNPIVGDYPAERAPWSPEVLKRQKKKQSAKTAALTKEREAAEKSAEGNTGTKLTKKQNRKPAESVAKDPPLKK